MLCRSYIKNAWATTTTAIIKVLFLFENFLREWMFRYGLVVSLILVLMIMCFYSISSLVCLGCEGEERQGEEDDEFYFHPGEQRAVTSPCQTVTMSQLSRTSQSAPLAHVTIIFYKKMLILINWCDIPNSVCWSGGCITVTGAPPPYHLAGQQHQQQDYCRLAVGIRLRLRSEEWGVRSSH